MLLTGLADFARANYYSRLQEMRKACTLKRKL